MKIDNIRLLRICVMSVSRRQAATEDYGLARSKEEARTRGWGTGNPNGAR